MRRDRQDDTGLKSTHTRIDTHTHTRTAHSYFPLLTTHNPQLIAQSYSATGGGTFGAGAVEVEADDARAAER